MVLTKAVLEKLNKEELISLFVENDNNLEKRITNFEK